MRVWVALSLLACASCGASTEERAVELPSIPPTDRDPLPFTPAPEASGHTDRTVSLSAAGGEDQARQMLLSLLRAVRDADERQLEQLFADELTLIQGRTRPEPRPRSVEIQHLLLHARRGVIQPDLAIEEMVDLTTVEVSRAAQHWPGRDLPEGVRPTDLVVEVTLLAEGRAPLRAMLQWTLRGQIVVRPGRDARIVAL